nr:hypothetical protein [Bacteroidota bacterium]
MEKNYNAKREFFKPLALYLTVCGLIACFIIISSVSAWCQDGDSNKFLKKLSETTYMLNDMEIDVENSTILIPCKVNMTEGLIEVLLCRPEGKTHESLFVTAISPLEFQTALLLLGIDPVNEIPEDSTLIDQLSPYRTIETSGDSVLIFVKRESHKGNAKDNVEKFIKDESKKGALKPSTWLFRGAVSLANGYVVLNPNTTIIATYHDPIALMELNAEGKFDDELYYVNSAAGLRMGEPVKLIIKALK